MGEIYWICLGRLNPIVRKPVLPFFLKMKLTSVSRGLCGVFLSTVRNLAYMVLSVIARSKLSFSYGCNGGNLMERFVGHHTMT